MSARVDRHAPIRSDTSRVATAWILIGVALGAALVGALRAAPDASAAPPGPETFASRLEAGRRLLGDAQSAYARGDRAAQLASATEAAAIFRELALERPEVLASYWHGCQAAAFQRDTEQAWQWVREFQARTPGGESDPEIHYLRAFVYLFAADRPETAILALLTMTALASNARTAERNTLMYLARMDLGHRLVSTREYAAGIKQLREAARLARRRGWRRKEVAALGDAGVGMRIARDWTHAGEVFALLREREPDNARWHWNAGLSFGDQLQFAEAIRAYGRVIELHEQGLVPERERWIDLVFLRIGNCHRNLAMSAATTADRTAHREAAAAYLRKYVGLAPDDPRGHRWLGTFHYPDLDQPYEAIPHFERATALDPDCDSSLRSLVQIHERFPPPPVAGESPEEEAVRLEAWAQRLAEMKTDLEENRARREAALEVRRLASGEDENGCE